MSSLAVLAQSSDYVPNQIIVKVKENTDVTGISEPVSTQQISGIEQSAIDENRYIINITGDVEKTIKDYEKDPSVEYAEPNYIASLAEQTDAFLAVVPNDPSFSSQYHHTNIQSNLSWNFTTGNGIKIAVIDTGVQWDHPDLAANIWNNTAENCTNSVDDDSNGKTDDCRGWDFVNNDNNPTDDHGHGTHVAGIAAAVGNNSINVVGVCWNCIIIPIKAFDSSGSATYTDIVDSLHYAADNGAKIISMSFTGPNANTLQEAIKYAYSKNVTLVAAAGNSNTNTGNIYPAAYEEVIAVGSTDSSDTKSSFSNYGSWVDVSAPGSSILSTYITNTTATSSGTSMATPIVSGLVGLILSKNSTFSQEEIRTLIRSSTNSITSPTVYIGTGRVNSFKAIMKNSSLIVSLRTELNDASLSGNVVINGTVNGTYLVNSSLYYGSGLYPSSFVAIAANNTNITNSSIYQWSTSLVADGTYTIKLEGNDTFNQSFIDTTQVTINNPPRVNIYSPVNGSTYTSINVSLTYFVVDGSIDSCRYSIDGTLNSIINCTNATIVNLSEGLHNLTFYANDSVNNTNTTQLQFRTDTLFPGITIANTNNSWRTSKNISINYSISDANIQTCRYLFNQTNTSLGNCENFSLTNLPDAYYNITVYVNDTANNTNSSILFFNIDTVYPLLRVESPANNTAYNTTLLLNYTASDANLNSCSYAINTSLFLFTNCGNTSINLSDGLYNLTIYTNDSANNTNSSTAQIKIDTTPPNASITIFPRNVVVGDNITVFFNVSDYLNISNVSAIWINISGYIANITITNNTYISNNISYNTSSLSIGTQSVNLYTNDSLNHTANISSTFEISPLRNITITFLNSSGNTTNASIFLYYQGQSLIKDNRTNTSSVFFVVPNNTWDLEILTSKFNTTMRNINLSELNITSNTSIDDVPESVITKTSITSSARTLVEIFALNTSMNFTNATLSSYYDSTGINDNYTDVFVCHAWSIFDRTCSGSWENITANSTINKTAKTFSINTSHFSSFALVESSYCGDTTCNAGSETCSTCATDCGACATTSSSSSSGGGGGGGGGGSVSTSNKTSYFFDRINPNAPIKIINTINNSPFNSIEITTSAQITSASIGLEKLNSNPLSISPSGIAYKYLSVTHSITEAKFKNVRFNFSITKQWITNNSIYSSKIYLQRYEEDHWKKYYPIEIVENLSHITYIVEVPGLSNFAITGDPTEKPVEAQAASIENTSEECTAGNRCFNNEIQSCTGNKWIVEKACEYGCEETSYGGTIYYGCASNQIQINVVCTESDVRCVSNRTEICSRGNWTSNENCEYGCNGNKCRQQKEDNMLLYVIVGLVMAATIAGLIYYKNHQHKQRHKKIEHYLKDYQEKPRRETKHKTQNSKKSRTQKRH